MLQFNVLLIFISTICLLLIYVFFFIGFIIAHGGLYIGLMDVASIREGVT